MSRYWALLLQLFWVFPPFRSVSPFCFTLQLRHCRYRRSKAFAEVMLRRSQRFVMTRSGPHISVPTLAATAEDNNDNVNPVTPSPRGKGRTLPSKGTRSISMKRKSSLSTKSPRKRSLSNMSSISTGRGDEVVASTTVLTTDMVAAINPKQPFLDLIVPPQELRPSATLTTGQCFHWQVVHPDPTSSAVSSMPDDDEHATKGDKNKVSAWGTHNATEFIGTLRLSDTDSMVISIRETPTTTLYRPLASTNSTIGNSDLHQRLRDYFQLDTAPLQPLYQEWSQACDRLAVIAKCIPGVRIIDQDPWECLVSFICSSNNNIPRITKMLSAIRREYGSLLLTIPSKDNTNHSSFEFFSFPSLNDLASEATDGDLRNKCGMGYRAKYILETVQLLQEKGGEAYLKETLRQETDPLQVQKHLCEFCGVGPKVADCVALFSLRQDDAIPVDTHVWNIALRDYDSPQAALYAIQSLTPTNYQKVGNVFRGRFPSKAGWAHSLLFVAELPSFRGVLPVDVIQEMDNFKLKEKDKKKQTQKKKPGME